MSELERAVLKVKEILQKSYENKDRELEEKMNDVLCKLYEAERLTFILLNREIKELL